MSAAALPLHALLLDMLHVLMPTSLLWAHDCLTTVRPQVLCMVVYMFKMS